MCSIAAILNQISMVQTNGQLEKRKGKIMNGGPRQRTDNIPGYREIRTTLRQATLGSSADSTLTLLRNIFGPTY